MIGYRSRPTNSFNDLRNSPGVATSSVGSHWFLMIPVAQIFSFTRLHFFCFVVNRTRPESSSSHSRWLPRLAADERKKYNWRKSVEPYLFLSILIQTKGWFEKKVVLAAQGCNFSDCTPTQLDVPALGNIAGYYSRGYCDLC